MVDVEPITAKARRSALFGVLAIVCPLVWALPAAVLYPVEQVVRFI